ncbi:MAG: hypothetical protein EXR76_19600 [Myxococcales bacterium]|nr:hypothetical protein [Myxococcales bacterium]
MRMSRVTATLFRVLALTACGGQEGESESGGTMTEADASGGEGGHASGGEGGHASGGEGGHGPAPECSAVLEACPDEATPPQPGQRCAPALSCDYTRPDTGNLWHFTCGDGVVVFEEECPDPAPGGSCGVPPLAQYCERPDLQPTPQAVVDFGPAGGRSFRPFADGDSVTAQVGGQGTPMLAWRLSIVGTDDVGCVAYTTRVRLASGGPALESSGQVQLHCGGSATIYTVLDPAVCSGALLSIEVGIEGKGEARSHALDVSAACLFDR